MAESTFRGIIDFFVRLGVYDVVLPFLLVFTIMFAILEKTKVLGTEVINVDGESVTTTKKNLNSMVSFCIAFFVILSRELVSVINEALANIVVLLLVSISFLLLVGSFMKQGDEPTYLESPWKQIFMVVMFIGVFLIFLHAIPTDDGSNWLEEGWDIIEDNWDTDWGGALIFILGVAVFMWWIVRPPKPRTTKSDS
jgi:hypothetical protein